MTEILGDFEGFSITLDFADRVVVSPAVGQCLKRGVLSKGDDFQMALNRIIDALRRGEIE